MTLTPQQQYLEEQILSASPARLLTMLYDRLILDLKRAEAAQVAQNWPAATPQLLHAQEIIAELSRTLKTDAWDGAEGLLATYTYVSNSLVNANIHRNVDLTREALRLLEPLREAWHEAAATLTATPVVASSGGSLGLG